MALQACDASPNVEDVEDVVIFCSSPANHSGTPLACPFLHFPLPKLWVV